jgi:hypothetical protein
MMLSSICSKVIEENLKFLVTVSLSRIARKQPSVYRGREVPVAVTNGKSPPFNEALGVNDV